MTERQPHSSQDPVNPYFKPHTTPLASLPNGTSLYPAYHPALPGQRYRRAMSSWNGASGEWVGVSLDGRLFRQGRYWGSDSPRADAWRQFRLAYS